MGGGGQQQATTQSQSTQQLPPWVNDAAQQNYAFAQNVANRPLQQYQGQMVADVAPQTQQAWNLAAQGGAAGQDQYNASQAGFLGVMGQSPQQVAAGQLSNTNLQPYMNPYTQSVINATLPIMQQNLGLQQNQQQNAASSAGAFGGSRQGVQQGVTQAQGAMNMAQMAGQLNQANFGQAQTAAQQDITGRYNAAIANQGVQQDQARLNLQAAQGLGTLGNQAQLSQMRNFQELVGAGSQQQQQAQNQINAQYGKFNQAWGYPTQQLGALQSALGMTPYGTATQGQSTTTQQSSPDYMMSALGGLQSLSGLLGAGGAFGVGGGLAGFLPKAANKGTARVAGPLSLPAHLDIMPHLLAPGEAVLNREAAQSLGRGKIHALNQAGLAKRSSNDNRGPPGVAPAGFGQGPPGAPLGPLAAPGVAGAIGALGSPMRGAPKRRLGKQRMPPIRGALG